MADASNFDYKEAFAENGQRSSIDNDKYKGGWVDVVGGINGIPTAQQFNAIMYHQEQKINAAYKMADDGFKAMSRITEEELDAIFDGTYSGEENSQQS